MASKISCIIHTRNEEKNLRDCIYSIKRYVDEVVVIDQESEDKTVSVAKKLGAKVYKYKYTKGYSRPARAFGIKKAKYKWILWLDADERVPDTLGTKIREIVQNDDCDLVKIPHKNVMLGKWIKHAGWWPDYHYRLFRKGHLVETVHPHAAPKIHGREIALPAIEKYAFVHYGHPNIDHMLNKYNVYSKLDKSFIKEYVDERGMVDPNVLIEYPKGEFYWRYIEMEGYKDGVHGYMIGKMREFYRFLVILRYWESVGYKEITDTKKLKKFVEGFDSTKDSQELINIKNSKFYKLWRVYRKCIDRLNFS